MKNCLKILAAMFIPTITMANEACDGEKTEDCTEWHSTADKWFEMGKTTISVPIHMPNLQTEMGGMEIEADVKSLAKNADSFVALKFEQEFGLFGQQFFARVEGWNGSYGMDSGLDFTVKELSINGDIGFSLEQQIVNGDLGWFVVKDWNGLSLATTIGVRSYKQNMMITGDVALNGQITIPPLDPRGRPKNIPIDQQINMNVPMLSNWTEATIGIEGAYQWTKRNELKALTSFGSDGSYRTELMNRYTFDNGVLLGAGGRIDDFKSDPSGDAVPVREKGFIIEVGYSF